MGFLDGKKNFLKNKTFFAEASSDGMTLDALGNVYVTQESVLIFNPRGKLLADFLFYTKSISGRDLNNMSSM